MGGVLSEAEVECWWGVDIVSGGRRWKLGDGRSMRQQRNQAKQEKKEKERREQGKMTSILSFLPLPLPSPQSDILFQNVEDDQKQVGGMTLDGGWLRRAGETKTVQVSQSLDGVSWKAEGCHWSMADPLDPTDGVSFDFWGRRGCVDVDEDMDVEVWDVNHP